MSNIGYVNGLEQRARREEEFQAHREWRRKHFGALARMAAGGVVQKEGEQDKIWGELGKSLAIIDYRKLSKEEREKPENVRGFLGKFLTMVIGGYLAFASITSDAKISVLRISDATPVFEKDGVKYFDPFDLSVTPYEELTDREKEYVDAIETGKIRRPGNAPGLEHLRPYFGKNKRSNSLVDRMKSSFMEGYQKSLRRRRG